MYAVIKTGGKQYRVENDQKLLVERINADEGSVVTLSDILMVVDSGKIIAEGNHEYLLSNSEIYTNFYNKQINRI